MATAVASGMPKLRIEESAAKRQARIDSGQGLFDIYCVLIQNFFFFFFFEGGVGVGGVRARRINIRLKLPRIAVAFN